MNTTELKPLTYAGVFEKEFNTGTNIEHSKTRKIILELESTKRIMITNYPNQGRCR